MIVSFYYQFIYNNMKVLVGIKRVIDYSSQKVQKFLTRSK